MGQSSATTSDTVRATNPPELSDLLDYVASHPRAMGLSLGANGLEWGRLPAELIGRVADYRPGVGVPKNTTSSLDLMEELDRRTAISAFARCWRTGFAECTVQASGDQEPHALTMWDLRAEVGTFVAIVVPGLTADEAGERVAPQPRLLVHTATDSGRTLTADPSIELLLGWTVEEFASQPRIDLVHPDDQTESILSWVEMLEAPGAVSRRRCRYRHKDGNRWVWFEITTTNLLESDGHVRCEMLDISESMAALDALYQREQLLRHLTESMPHGIVHMSTEGKVLFANDHLATIAGTQGTPLEFLQQIPPDDRSKLYRAFDRALEGFDSDVEGSIFRVDGTERRCHTRVRSLGNRDAGVLVSIEDITDRWKQACELAERAATDSLTGVLNRRAILELLAKIQEEARWSGTSTTVAFLDFNDFKLVNDEYGHRIGDRVLAAIAASIKNELRPGDGLGRLGGDEFLVVCRDTAAADAAALATRLRRAVSKEVEIDGHTVQCTTSCGLATDTAGSLSVEALIHAADRSMYQDKNESSVR